MTISRRALLFGVPLATLGVAAIALDRKFNPHTGLHYQWPVVGAGMLQATPDCVDADHPTLDVTEGPFYKPDTPLRSMLRERDTFGTPLTLRGRVVGRDCKPIAGAVVDVWSCDGNGVYDNDGFTLRGHQFTDANGGFAFETVRPSDYRNFGIHRTPHIHVKVQGRGTRLLTTQLFFPRERLNAHDFFFRKELLVQLAENVATFNFVL